MGYDAPGGFCRLEDAEDHADVGCEACHGPGGGHAQDPGDPASAGPGFTRANHADICLGCHTPEHSDQFDFSAYLPKILGPGHGQPDAPASEKSGEAPTRPSR